MNRTLSPDGKPGADASHHGADCLTVVRKRLVSLIEKESLPKSRKGREGLTAPERAQAGIVLGQLGDPRPGVGVNDGLPDIDWIKIPAGEFIMGGEAEYDGGGEYVCDLIKSPYRISRYPITVGQYQAFVDDNGYDQERFWTKAGWKWRTDGNITGLVDSDPPFLTPNHPREGVSWFEATAFCGWLSHKLGRDIRLPSEVEWERAARGQKGRLYPWGSARNFAERCNCGETELGHTSAVGLFPSGNAECGAADLAGNVWEWCRTLWGKDWEEAEFGEPYRPDGGRENPEAPEGFRRGLRGASWFGDVPGDLLSSSSNSRPRGIRFDDAGFRVVWVGMSAR